MDKFALLVLLGTQRYLPNVGPPPHSILKTSDCNFTRLSTIKWRGEQQQRRVFKRIAAGFFSSQL